MKHKPFESIYRENYEIVEERRGNVRLYCISDSSPKL